MKAVDVMGFAGGFSAGVDQAGFDVIAKREPSEFKGFGMDQHVYNMPWLDAQVSEPKDWDLPHEDVELVYGCPPCSGFSALSFANKRIHGTIVGPDADINQCMRWLVQYAARVKPEVVILESVGVAFKNGRDWMEGLWEELCEKSGVDYYLTHVNMNNAWVGGDVIRPRYFFVAHKEEAFGVGLEYVNPKNASEVLADLPAELEEGDADWGHSIYNANGPHRMIETMKWLKEEHGRTWKPGTRLPDNVQGLEPPEYWLRKDGKVTERAEKMRGEGQPAVYSHWFSTDPFATFRWYPDKPFGVVVAAVLDRAIHPVHDRTLTFREAARFMTLPDDWSLRPMVTANRGDVLGKAVTSAAGKWIAHWAKMCIEGTPGELAGEAADYDDRIRVINVQSKKHIEALDGSLKGMLWGGEVASSDPATWIIDRKERPAKWWQRADVGAWRDDTPPGVTRTRRARDTAGQEKDKTRPKASVASRAGIVRVAPEQVQAYLDEVGLDKKAAAERLGVSYSRINELTTHTRPGSWLNEERWADVKEKLRG